MEYYRAVFCAVAFAGVFSSLAGQLVVNSGFEEGVDGKAAGWRIAARYDIGDSAGLNGNRGLHWKNAEPGLSGTWVAQDVKVKSGFIYRFGGWAKCKDIRGVAKDGVKSCVVIIVTVLDAHGKYLGEYYSKRLHGTADWTMLEAKTPRLPPGAAILKVSPFVWHNATGEAWFDEIFVESVESKPIAGLYSSAYRDTAWSGDVRFFAALGVDVAAYPLETLSAEFACSDGAYGTKRIPATSFSASEASVAIPVADLPKGVSAMSFELREKKGRKLLAEETILFTRTDNTPGWKCRIDGANRLIVDGRTFFPFGFYVYNVDDALLDVYRQGPFNTILPYPYLPVERFDLIATRGLKIIATLKDFMPAARYAPCKIETQGDADRGFLRRFGMVKDHPAVIGWYLNDESSVDHLPRLERQYRYVRSLDPDHPAWSVLFQHDQIRSYAGTCDVIGTDPYPINSKPIGQVAEYARDTVKGFFGRPVWMVPQSFAWKWFNPTGDDDACRMPTKAEIRSMTWQAIANGANGIIYYALGTMRTRMKPEEFAASWKGLCEIGEELSNRIPILLADPSPNATGYPAGVSGRAWTKDGMTYLLVANETREPQSATLTLPRRFAKMSGSLDDAHPSLAGDALSLNLPSLGVTMLELEN